MMKKIISVLFVLIVFQLGCDEESTKPNDAQNPEFLLIRIDNRWNLNTADSNLVEIKVSDPQGFDDLKNIALKVLNSTNEIVFSDSLYDDGNLSGSTDLIAGDGVFRNLFLPSVITSNVAGTFTFDFEIMDKSGNSAGELKKDISFGFNEAPSIESVVVPSQLLSGADPEIISVVAPDPDGDNQQTKVFLDLLQNNLSVLAQPIQLSNNGDFSVSGDAFAGDSIYSFKMESDFSAGRMGAYKIEFIAEDEFGDKSAVVSRDISIENKTGMVLSVSVPDTIERPTQGFAMGLVTARVSDPQSLADVDSVYFNSIKPDGNPASGNPFSMVDNGLAFNIANPLVEAGDEVEGDGVYSITIFVDSSNLPGIYEFSFYMRDKAGNLTTALTDSIEVK